MWGRAEHGRKTVEGTVTPMKSLCTPIRITKEEKNMSSEQSSRTVTQLMKELFQHDMDVRSLKIGNERMQGKGKHSKPPRELLRQSVPHHKKIWSMYNKIA